MQVEEKTTKKELYVGQHNRAIIQDDEIDLLELFGKIYDILLRKYKLLILMTIVGMLIGGSYYKWKSPVYKSYLIGTSEVLNVEQVKYLVNNLKLHLENKGFEALAEKLYLKEEEARTIVDINVLEDKTDGENTFYLELSRNTNEPLERYQKGIVDYFENNAFVKTRVNLKRESIQNIIESLRLEEKELMNLSAIMKENIGSHVANKSNQSSINNFYIPDITEVSKQKLLLKEKELELTSQLNLLSGIQVVQDFNNYNNPSNQWNAKALAVLIMAPFALSLMIVFLTEFLRMIKTKRTTQTQYMLR